MRNLAFFLMILTLFSCLAGCGRGRRMPRRTTSSSSSNYQPGAGEGQCATNMKNLATALEMESTDHQGRYPMGLSDISPQNLTSARLEKLPSCPVSGKDYVYERREQPDGYTITCGADHSGDGLAAGFPYYTSEKGLVKQ